MNERYLRPDVAIEPLVGGWYSTLWFLSPATAGPMLANYQLPILESFLESPTLHEDAGNDPELMGFLPVKACRRAEVERRLERTRREGGPLLALAGALKALHELLAREATGGSLETLYPQVPAPLRGYVELFYDIQHRPGFRLFEGLLYRDARLRASQSVRMSRIDGGRRPFLSGKLRLCEPAQLDLEVELGSQALAHLLAARRAPTDTSALAEELGVATGDHGRFARMFTATPPPAPRARFAGPGVRVRYFGHAAVLVETARAAVLFDPGISLDVDGAPERFTLADLPEQIDYVVLTHAHSDHVWLDTLLELRPRVGAVLVPRSGHGHADPSLRLALRSVGFVDVRELSEGDEVALPGGHIIGLPFLGEHGDLDILSKLGYTLTLEGRTLVIAADSNALEPAVYDRMPSGRVDALFLGLESVGSPMSVLYGPLLAAPLGRKSNQARRLCGSNFERAADVVDRLLPRRVVAYALGQEPWCSHVLPSLFGADSHQMQQVGLLMESCRARNIEASRPYGRMELWFRDGD